MILFITGTPGTGKTTVSKLFKEQFSFTLVDVNQMVDDEKLYTGIHKKGYKIVDIPALCSKLGDFIRNLGDGEDLLVEGHLSHFCGGADRVIVLRTHPDILGDRLQDKGFEDAKIAENVEAEALDVCAFEAYQEYGDRASEVDTTGKNPEEVVGIIKMIIDGEKTSPVGGVDFSGYLGS
ncbi:MAG: adenylate kinase family protein [Methanobacterium sp.]